RRRKPENLIDAELRRCGLCRQQKSNHRDAKMNFHRDLRYLRFINTGQFRTTLIGAAPASWDSRDFSRGMRNRERLWQRNLYQNRWVVTRRGNPGQAVGEF